MNALYETLKKMSERCRHAFESFLKKISKYAPSLRDGGTGNVVKDVSMKIRWQISHCDDLTKLGAELNAHKSAINMLLAAASV